MVEVEEKVGNPWSILPIKNSKYARDLIEVHLSDRHLTRLEKFEDFPNLEVIWLKNNNVSETLSDLTTICQLRNLDGIHTNFRVKEVYASNNSLTQIKGIEKYKFL